MHPKTLTPTERLILRNQFEILALLDPDGRREYEEQIAVVERGYEYQYRDLFQVLSDPMPVESSQEVWDILVMYETLQRRAAALKSKKIPEDDLPFPGFDGNDEEEVTYMAYTRFIVEKMQRFVNLKREDFNSHREMLPTYRRMLATWRGFGGRDGPDLSEDQVVTIMES